MSAYPSDAYVPNLKRNSKVATKLGNATVSQDELVSSMLLLTVYYDELEYTYINQWNNFFFITLVINFGGMLSVFLGMSLLSVIDLMEMGVNYAMIFYYKLRLKLENRNKTYSHSNRNIQTTQL